MMAVRPRRAAAGPAVLALSGLEPTGRAGLFADLQAIRASGGFAVGIATALTAQGDRTFAVLPVARSILRAQIRAACELESIAAVKLGMVWDRAALRSIFRALKGVRGFWIVDPVTRTSRGQRLSALRPGDYLASAEPNVVLTPNWDEAAWLLEQPRFEPSVDRAAQMGVKLANHGFAAVIVKGGHLAGRAVDVLCTASGVRYLEGTRLPRTRHHRGTGCRFASVLATALGRGQTIPEAALEAKAYVRSYLARSKDRR